MSAPGSTRHNIHHHYDLGNDFYRLWLDREMVYTCAYFPSPDTTLEDAQRAKMEYVCWKLDLRPDDRVVEAGCGWGALALYMARQHGVTVRAFNISREQIRYARAHARWPRASRIASSSLRTTTGASPARSMSLCRSGSSSEVAHSHPPLLSPEGRGVVVGAAPDQG
jgi:cyclopropane fatty-acyl-phospholipid synthase-like methyltransferase